MLFCSYSFFCLAGLKVPDHVLVVYTCDSTFTTYKNSDVGAAFDSYIKISRLFDPLITRAEDRVFNNVDLLLWSSRWLKDSVDRQHKLTGEKSHVVNWGANIATPSEQEALIDLPIEAEIRLLFVGRDWIPKGGCLVHEILESLNRNGVDATLTVVGCAPPLDQHRDNLVIHEQLDKKDPKEYELLVSLYRTSHFFVMPSYESYGFAFCEASAYGLPSLCLRVGGVPVENGLNGYALEKDASASDFVDVIESYRRNPNRYLSLRRHTRDYFLANLNWAAWGHKTRELILQKLR